ncbi:MAG TPA: ABC transporter permease [Chitinophagaceae bacterium]|nr:ABC transporter permease [Chitinophagaceae bacterium]
MLTNYLKTTFRNLWKNKGFSFLNIFGLAVGITCAAFIFLWVEDELTYNNYFGDISHLYKVKDQQTYDGTTFTFDATPGPLAAGMKAEIPGIKTTARSTWSNRFLFSLNDKNIYEQGNFVDSGFLSMFPLKFVKGNAASAFPQLYSIVISEKMANTFFNSTDVIGKTIKANNDQNFTITGVIKDLPENISFKFDWLAPFKINEDRNQWLKGWGSNGILTYAEVEPNANVDAINKKLYGYIQTKQQGTIAKMMLYPMTRWRLYDSFENGKEVSGRIKYVNLFSTIAWIILIIACINFMNLSTARSEKRAREVGVRKVMGAGKFKLIKQFISESILIALISALVAVGLLYIFINPFNTLVDKHMSVDLFNPYHIGALVAIALVAGIIAGSYPAFYLSSFNPVMVLKGLKVKTSGGAGFIRKSLVVLQFTISVWLIIGTVIIYQQINHIKDRNIGYNKQGLAYFYLQGNLKEHFNAVKNELLATGMVENATLSNNQILQLGSNTGDFTWPGKNPNKQVLITVESVSPEYINTMGMHLNAGQDFYSDMKADSGNVIINETLAKIMKQKNIIGSVLSYGNQKYTVKGVINDFVYNDMYGQSAPLVLFSDTSNVYTCTVRYKANANLPAAIAKTEAIVKKANPGYPFECKFVDQEFDKLFKTETLIGKLASVFAVLAILISCLGLFGLSAYTAERRTKEIGIRKVLGATEQGLAALLSKDFLILVVMSCVIAFPFAWLTMNKFLQDYAYRIKISPWVFIAAGLLAVIIALLTVSYQAIKAALSNPIKSLRSE